MKQGIHRVILVSVVSVLLLNGCATEGFRLDNKAASDRGSVQECGPLFSGFFMDWELAFSILHTRNECVILSLTEAIKYAQWQEAIKAREELYRLFHIAAQRYMYYERLLGRDASDISFPELDPLDTSGLDAMRFRMTEPEMPLRGIPLDGSPAQGYAFQSNLAAGEINQIFKQIRAAQIREYIAQREWESHKQKIRYAEDIERFLECVKNRRLQE